MVVKRYGFKQNTFNLKLEPLVDVNHRNRFIYVDGFNRLKEIDEYLKNVAKKDGPQFFLVTGKSGTGRTCVANFLLACYREHRGIPQDQFVVPILAHNINHSEFNVFKNWLLQLV